MELFLPLKGRENFIKKMLFICSKGFEIDFLWRKQNHPNRKWNYFFYFQASDQKLLLQNITHLFQGAQHRFSKQETESLEQELDYFSYLQASDQKLLLQNISHLFQEAQN